jgi:heat shock protein HslJ
MIQDVKLKKVFILLVACIALLSCVSTKKSTPVITPTDMNNSLTETYWRLTALVGQPIVYADGEKKEMHIILKKEGNRVTGNGGCNSFTGSYMVQAGNRISFSQLASTLMACANMVKEKEFLDMLPTVDNYAIKGNILSLNKAKMAPLAKFEAVYLK